MSVSNKLKSMITTCKNARAIIRDHRANKYITYWKAAKNYLKYKSLQYETYSLNEATRFKKSDTIFVLATGPSVNNLTKDEIEIIRKHDVLTINFAFLKKEIIPTYFLMSFEPTKKLHSAYIKAFSSKRNIYNNVLHFLPKKAVYRFGHPKLIPLFFAEQPKLCIVPLPKSITIDRYRPFNDTDFSNSFFYRGTGSLALHLAITLDYKNIVQLGVDLNSPRHFYDEKPDLYEEAREIVELCQQREKELSEELRYDYGKAPKYVSMVPKGNKANTYDQYLYYLGDYLKRKSGITLYIGKKDNMLYPGLPAYFD